MYFYMVPKILPTRSALKDDSPTDAIGTRLRSTGTFFSSS